METYSARAVLTRTRMAFATHVGGYEILFEPHLLGSMITVRGKKKLGTWLLADAPTKFVLALASALNKQKARRGGIPSDGG